MGTEGGGIGGGLGNVCKESGNLFRGGGTCGQSGPRCWPRWFVEKDPEAFIALFKTGPPWSEMTLCVKKRPQDRAGRDVD